MQLDPTVSAVSNLTGVLSRGVIVLLTQRIASHANITHGMPQSRQHLRDKSISINISPSRLDEDSWSCCQYRLGAGLEIYRRSICRPSLVRRRVASLVGRPVMRS